ncbi:MAG: lactate utilization protein C [Actinobacteria bacterium]|nr:lactate utilization protein C [Actinomycetota bacterium]
MNAREEVLARIRTALGRDAGPATAAPAGDGIPRQYRTTGSRTGSALLDLLAERLADYRAHVRRCPPGELTAVAAAALTERGARRLVIPPGLQDTGLDPAGLAAQAGAELITDDGLPPARLDTLDGVITGAAAAIAETGTIVLDGSPDQGRRAISLIPDYHLCILRATQVVHLVPEALTRLTPAGPLTWISGPSATSDIELDRVEGVHGPRRLEVILVSPAAG